MSNKRFWIGILALVVGVALAHVQTRRRALRPSPVRPVVSAPVEEPPADSSPPRPPALMPKTTASAEPAASESATAALEPIVPSFTPEQHSHSALLGVSARSHAPLAYSPSDRLNMPSQDEDKLWVARFESELARGEAKGDILSLLDPKTEKDEEYDPLEGLKIHAANVGTTYPLLKSDDTTFRGQFAGGFSRDYNALKEGQHIAEVVFGFQFEHAIDQRNKLEGAVEFGRDVTDRSRTRVRTQAAWEVLLDPDKNVSLRTGVLTRANTTPDGEQSKNVDYSLDLIWKF